MRYIPSIGMEVHAQLLTESKMFCACPVRFGDPPNTNVCPTCLGMPGTLPVPNKKAVEHVIRTALALNCQIAPVAMFYRKNYFYPDLPKGYQISQYGDVHPIGTKGYLEIEVEGERFPVRIKRVHLEEDTGKLFHYLPGESEVDFNRAGAPLMEIVTDFPPDLHSAEAAKEYLVQLRAVLTYLGVCDGKMEEGSLRCEPNISVAPEGSNQLGVKTELKNLNSFRSVVRGIEFEIERQIKILKSGGQVVQETRGWNEEGAYSFPLRTKEYEQDYRYFPEPDIVPIRISAEWLEELRATIPELPLQKADRYRKEYKLSATETRILTADIDTANYFEQCVQLGVEPKIASNWITVELQARLNETGISIRESKLTPAHLADLIDLLHKGVISGRIAKELFDEVFRTGELPSKIVQERGMVQISDEDALRAIARKVIAENPDVVAKYRAGKTSVLGYLVGQMMRETQGRANPQRAQQLLREELGG
ncbi:MAG: Asp-tRNA(Asn)/Glu-tRNA(Gln) amidotransferase subunit GatB [Fimbriimonadales bacterium]|nr:Asp-tRNA(Asn)/Glu-tRNA(Gln) amidotransferase subunit GatB [Fimbriimonadales bacterium]